MIKVFKKRKILITGHTGFKGAWLCFWLNKTGAALTGISLDPNSPKDVFHALNIQKLCNDYRQDINDYESVVKIFQKEKPEIVFHLAAQALVLKSYKDPKNTFQTNIMGTVNILEACKNTPSVKSVLIITSDKCYENKEWIHGYRETDRLGGKDPYSASKAAAEIVVNAYRESFLNKKSGVSLATARAGNVIGGGDWAENRIMPDIMNALINNETIEVRNPDSIRPWQHVMEPLYGYLLLMKKMLEEPEKFSESWNFGPSPLETVSVKNLVEKTVQIWGQGGFKITNDSRSGHEASRLILDISKVQNMLGWNPKLSFTEALKMTIEWYKEQSKGKDLIHLTNQQIKFFETKIA